VRTPVTVGVIGLGAWGPNLVRVFDELPGADLRWICDSSSAAVLRAKAHVRAARATASVDELLADESLDAVVVATPPSTHYPLARRAVDAGKHVLVETPLALRGEDADALVHLAEASGRHVMAGHVLLFDPAVRRLKELVDHGRLGELYYLTSQRLGPLRVPREENALWDLGAHDVSALLYLVGDEPIEVRAHADEYGQPGLADVILAALTFATGIRAHIHLSWLEARRTRRITAVGSERTAILDNAESERRLTLWERDPLADVISPGLAAVEPLRVECEHFLAAVRSGAEAVAGVREAAAVVNVLEALQRSLERDGAPEAVGATQPTPGVLPFPART
jgi:predicted dehydrogenase